MTATNPTQKLTLAEDTHFFAKGWGPQLVKKGTKVSVAWSPGIMAGTAYRSQGGRRFEKALDESDAKLFKSWPWNTMGNPAESAAQYRLAQAVLSGTARETGMTKKVAREIVERTPARLRSGYMETNPHKRYRVLTSSGSIVKQTNSLDEAVSVLVSHGERGGEVEDFIEGRTVAVLSAQGKMPFDISATEWRSRIAGQVRLKIPGTVRVAAHGDIKVNPKHKSGPIGEATKMLGGVGKFITKPISKAGEHADKAFGKLIGHNPTVRFASGDRAKDKRAAEQYKRLMEYDGRQARVEKSWGEGYQVVVNPPFNLGKKYDIFYKGEPIETLYASSGSKAIMEIKRLDPSYRGKKLVAVVRKGNPESEAASMYESFHGSPSEDIAVFEEEEHYHGHLAELGQLIEIRVYTVTGLDATFSFDYQGKPDKCVILASNEDGSSLYAIGGDQSLPLKDIKMDKEEYLKDSMVIGDAYFVSYFTEKDFDKFQPTIYEHQLGEETGELPVLRYDRLNERIYLDGGAYCIKKPLLETSPGIEN